MSQNPRDRRDEKKEREREWYSVSYQSIKRTVQLLVFVVLVIGGAAFYQQWEHERKRDRAETLIREATELTLRIADRADYEQVRREYHTAWDALAAAEAAFEDEKFAEAISLGERSSSELESILQADEIAVEGRGRFVAVEGNVEFRRGERGAWKRARAQDTVNPGDWVKTSAGASAKIVFPGGGEYVLRANALVNLTIRTDRFGRSENVADVQFGTLQLSTGQSRSRVTTPKAQAQVETDTEATVAYDRENERAAFDVVAGSGMEVTSENGQSRFLSPLDRVVQEGDTLSATISLPDRPRLVSPADDRDVDLKDEEVRLTWAPVPGAESYALQISRNPLFASKIIDDDERRISHATLGLKREGVYYWQVAAKSDDAYGPWSEPRVFKVANLRRADPNDATPPPLAIEDVQTFGSLLIVSGRTEAGVTVEVNGEAAEVLPDGSFSKALQVDQEGFSFVEVTATDARGNTASEERRVFFDTSY